MMNALLIGSTGMLGSEISRTFRARGHKVVGIPRNQMELLSECGCVSETNLRREIAQKAFIDGIDTVVNCAAFTDTALIERDPKSRAKSFFLNALVPKVLASVCESLKLHLVHISTDYVFSEFSCSGSVCPITHYSTHKLMSELYVENAMPSGDYTILRVGWIYGTDREKSFIHKFLANCVRSVVNGLPNVPVVDDQESTPTSCMFAASSLAKILESGERRRNGIFSVSPLESATRYGFAIEILKNVDNLGDWFKKLKLIPVENSDARPKRTVMQGTDLNYIYLSGAPYTWRDDLRDHFFLNGEHYRNFISSAFMKEESNKRRCEEDADGGKA